MNHEGGDYPQSLSAAHAGETIANPFPQFILRDEPFLAAAATNGFYSAFRARRDRHGRYWTRALVHALVEALSIPAFIVLGFFLVSVGSCIGLCGGMALIAALHVLLRTVMLPGSGGLKTTLEQTILGSRHIPEQVRNDLAAIPRGPLELGYALLYERLDVAWLTGPLSILIMATLLAWALIWQSDPTGPGDLFLALTLVAVSVRAWRWVVFLHFEHICKNASKEAHAMLELSAAGEIASRFRRSFFAAFVRPLLIVLAAYAICLELAIPFLILQVAFTALVGAFGASGNTANEFANFLVGLVIIALWRVAVSPRKMIDESWHSAATLAAIDLNRVAEARLGAR